MFIFKALFIYGIFWGLFGRKIMSLKDDHPFLANLFQFIPAGIMLGGLIYYFSFN